MVPTESCLRAYNQTNLGFKNRRNANVVPPADAISINFRDVVVVVVVVLTAAAVVAVDDAVAAVAAATTAVYLVRSGIVVGGGGGGRGVGFAVAVAD